MTTCVACRGACASPTRPDRSFCCSICGAPNPAPITVGHKPRTDYVGKAYGLAAGSTWVELHGSAGRFVPQRLVLTAAPGVTLDQLVAGSSTRLLSGALLLHRAVDEPLQDWPAVDYVQALFTNNSGTLQSVHLGFWCLVAPHRP